MKIEGKFDEFQSEDEYEAEDVQVGNTVIDVPAFFIATISVEVKTRLELEAIESACNAGKPFTLTFEED